MAYAHVTYGMGFHVLPPDYKPYGLVRMANGREYVRNYGRHLRDDKGMSFMEMFQWRFRNHYKDLPTQFRSLFKEEEVG